MISSLIWLLVLLAVLGIIYWAVQSIPMPPPVRIVAYAILAIIALVLVARLLMGLLGAGPVW